MNVPLRANSATTLLGSGVARPDRLLAGSSPNMDLDGVRKWHGRAGK